MGEHPLIVRDILFWMLHLLFQLPFRLLQALLRKARCFFPAPFLGYFWRVRDLFFKQLYLAVTREVSEDGHVLLVDAPTEQLSAMLGAKKKRLTSLKSSLPEFRYAAAWLRRSLLSSYVHLERWHESFFFPDKTFSAVVVFSPLLLENMASPVRVLKRNGTLLLIGRGKLPIHPPIVHDVRWRKTVRLNTLAGAITIYKGVRCG